MIYYKFCRKFRTAFEGHPDERSTLLNRSLVIVNLKVNILISTPDKGPPLLKGHFSNAKGLTSQEGFHCIQF